MTMSMGEWCVYSNSTKQKLASQSSTESKLIGVHDALPQMLWAHNFLIGQGYGQRQHIISR